jgi:putative IMPACT (imprinted ancient) family translation regulator
LLSQELTNVLIVVVRYFGGIQLGVPGLINAYRSAASDALAHAQIVEKTAKEQLTFRFSYEAMNDVMTWLKEEKAEILSQQFDADCVITIAVPRSKADNMRDKICRFGNSSLPLA